jgi:homoserine kinase
VAKRFVVRVPASSANLGPGFDVFAAALALHLELEVCEAPSFAIDCDLPVANDRTNLCVRAFERLHPADGFAFRIRSDIPISGGLGSSAAAIVAGLAAAAHVCAPEADLLALATELEGHSDNVAAALLGGFVICADGEATRFDPPPGLDALVVVPHEGVTTAAARAALPTQVPLADAVFNTAHGALLILGLARGDLDLVARGLADRLHQDSRAHLFPRTSGLLALARDLGALGATVSGAGPSLLLWCVQEETASVIEALRPHAEGWATVYRTPFELAGASVRDL